MGIALPALALSLRCGGLAGLEGSVSSFPDVFSPRWSWAAIIVEDELDSFLKYKQVMSRLSQKNQYSMACLLFNQCILRE